MEMDMQDKKQGHTDLHFKDEQHGLAGQKIQHGNTSCTEYMLHGHSAWKSSSDMQH
jgi:hypothetical protein